MFFYHVSLYHLTLNVPDEGYFRNTPSTINWISVFLFIIMKKEFEDTKMVIRVRKLKTKRQHNAMLCKVKILLNPPCATPFEHSGHLFFDCDNIRSDPEFKLLFTDAVLDLESITQHPDNKNI